MHTPSDHPVYVDDLLIALQKSFSRVVRQTNSFRKAHPEGELALMVDPVQFEITIKATSMPGEPDRLLYHPQGDIQLVFRGRIDPDFEQDRL